MSKSPGPKRPAGVTWLALLVFVLSGVNLTGVAGLLLRWDIYRALDLTVPLWALVAFRGTWGSIWLIGGWGLWRLNDRIRRLVIGALPVYAIMSFGGQFVFAQGDYDRARLPLLVVFGMLFGGIMIYVLTRKSIKQAFAERDQLKETEAL